MNVIGQQDVYQIVQSDHIGPCTDRVASYWSSLSSLESRDRGRASTDQSIVEPGT